MSDSESAVSLEGPPGEREGQVLSPRTQAGPLSLREHRPATCRGNLMRFWVFPELSSWFLGDWQTPTVGTDDSIAFFVAKATVLLKLREILSSKQS